MPESDDVRLSGALDLADRATGFVERPIRRLGGPARLNPLPHAGTISVFLLGVVVLTGLYITLFFEFGHAASYDSVARMEDHAIQKVARAAHRYASALLVLTTLVHAWRILVSGRFTGHRRRWRWASGVASLTFVWLAGVTGYWLVWDRRAAAINEAVAGLLRPFDFGRRFAVDQLLGVSAGSGAGFLLLIWFAHLGLTAVLGWFTWRHLRRSKLPWLPPKHWMAAMGGALVVMSLLAPVGMLGPARPDQQIADMPLDPFVLFLLPPLLGSARWPAVALIVLGPLLVAIAPRLLRRRDAAPVVIDEAACTGCELCVIDCPYDALSMRTGAAGSVAVLEPEQCVACGICVGSCAFDAIELPGAGPAPDRAEVAGREVLVVCDRHDISDLQDRADTAVVPVRCAGLFAPGAVRGFAERGATSVQLIGCAPSDCRYGTGNQIALERMTGERAPHVPRRYAARVATDLVHSGEVPAALAEPGDSTRRDAGSSTRQRMLMPALVVAASVGVVVLATRAPFRSPDPEAGLRVVVDHQAGAPLSGLDVAPAALDEIEVRRNGNPLGHDHPAGDATGSVDWHEWPLPLGPGRIEVLAVTADETVTLFDEVVDVGAGNRLVITAFDEPSAPGTGEGRDVFRSRAAGCTVCHSTSRGDDGVGPTLYGVASVAGERIEGVDAEFYLRQSILLPDQYVVDGWPAGQMLPIYRERLTEQQLEALIAYLLTLTAEEDG